MDSTEAMNKLLLKIGHMLDDPDMIESDTRMVLNLAEAYAWLMVPGQPHGGPSASAS